MEAHAVTPEATQPKPYVPPPENLTGERLVKDSPAIRKPGWLPTGLWDELDELAERHEAAIEGLDAAASELHELRERHEAEDNSRVEAIRAGIDPPAVSTPAEREEQVEEAKARVTAAEQELADAALAAVEGIREHAEEWLADLDTKAHELKEAREEAKEAFVQASTNLARMKPTRHWVQRTARLHVSRAWDHIAFDQLKTPLVERPDDLVNKLYIALGIPPEERAGT